MSSFLLIKKIVFLNLEIVLKYSVDEIFKTPGANKDYEIFSIQKQAWLYAIKYNHQFKSHK